MASWRVLPIGLGASLGPDSHGSPIIWEKPLHVGEKELGGENINILSEIQKCICSQGKGKDIIREQSVLGN